ncbi:helix-turn-helix domain-containing protein [Paenibacillus sp. Leaf72]|uniref:helix-turn-helix domain-containing protein n=1 Tax=Paenibacillus sp. Leaf72 TaxID=1736234 RepID=UPI0006F23486|nr:helix-turn-helix domain-containing protein [Paenibacillus sp. Leaf72]KQO12453.1 hypothetical protein ASF12_31045 [Paenibacillus sp. Leaf72]
MAKTSEELAQEIEVFTTSVTLVEGELETLRRAAAIIRIRKAQDYIQARNVLAVPLEHQEKNSKYVSADEVAEMFGISVQGVYKWIKLGKIDTEKLETPGSSKNLIVRSQFDVPKYQKQIEAVRRTKEALSKVKPAEKDEDLYPISDEDADMEELDVK